MAYRTFNPSKSNIDFAYDAFKSIKKIGDCEVIALDVNGFFDNLDPILLKEAWKNLLNQKNLPKDHYAVYRACTRSYGIEVQCLNKLFSRELSRRRGKNNAVVCSPQDFRLKVVPKLKPTQNLVNQIKKKPILKQLKGIPQGLPISAVLANLYMLDMDKILSKKINNLGGEYRRYSDDIFLIVPIGRGEIAEKSVEKELKRKQLEIQPKKTRRVVFRKNKDQVVECFKLNENYDQDIKKTVASYLGFEFDGAQISVRNSTISRFMLKAKRAIKRAELDAKKRGELIKRRQLYARLTRLGYGSVYGQSVYKLKILPEGVPRLGFFKYMSKAERVTDSKAIRKQIAQVESRIFRLINEADKKVELSKKISY